ncbi:para-nitrobenzyl esterase [Rhizomicrobium palustre]|uniref:Carboxylic ester hydrolase n=1 Tax=Rhizomicrobium palustre TaxID=189966 RepID=A0A846MYT8_9PROT|nr:carboxylesterase family protein [Rhizomicrobium palustre]NIK88606.1 para-nitrobenzyl esterase [Rhizomicrobium palustre]
MQDENSKGLSRRHAMLLSAMASAGIAMPVAAQAGDSIKTAAHSAPGGCSTPRSAIAKTQYGKVRGFVEGGVFTFKGIPYGATTAGENRWLPAKAPKKWEGEYPALVYGDNCPQNLHDFTSIEQSFLQDWDDGPMSEDMLKLNIWTPSLSGSRAVMVYFHGGGFSFGSSYELPSHEGAQMARHHDVVQVSVNHRLNALGFFDVSEIGGAAYEGSVNVGMTDLVFALKWVQENIANFGGDPNKVMIYGQSGGGSKVTTLLGMNSAAGLFHRASVQSGGGGLIPTGDMSKEFARQVVKELGIGPKDIGALQKIEWAKLFAAGNAVAAKMNPPWKGFFAPGPMPTTPRVGWSPTLDGNIITLRSFQDAAPTVSKNVPMLIGSVSEEAGVYHNNPTEAEWRESLAKGYGPEKADALVAAMKKAHPEKQIRTLSYGVAGLAIRNNITRMAKLKYDLGAAPVYQYWFSWQSPMLDGVLGAWHTAELAFCFDNTKRCEQATGDTAEARAIAKKMATAWANFARTGNPSQPGLAWTPSDPIRNQAMVFDKTCGMVDDPEGAVRKILLG